MPLNRGTQKQIAQRFQRNLGYFRKAHYWRRWRFLAIFILSFIGTAALAWFFFEGPEKMYNPGPISQHHTDFASKCTECHEKEEKLLAGATLKFANGEIDKKCQGCHQQHSFHHPSVAEGQGRSCTACHQEHKGTGSMAAVADLKCLHCHGSSNRMQGFAAASPKIAAALVDFRPDYDWKVFRTPARSYPFTNFNDFSTNHPEFRLVDPKLGLRDTNTLMFNHYRHLVELKNLRLDCVTCHEPAAGGAFMRPISYERHCQSCHSLQFDPKYSLKVPHGSAEHARAFLRSLQLEYADIAQREGIRGESAIRKFVADEMNRLQGDFVEGTRLENLILTQSNNVADVILLSIKSDSSRKLFETRLRERPGEHAQFDGCATCHEVTAKSLEPPAITKPWAPDRWMVRAHFDHSKHRISAREPVECIRCHGAALKEATGKKTSEILMPSISLCTGCHGPERKHKDPAIRVASDCATCHTYHTPKAATNVVSQALYKR